MRGDRGWEDAVVRFGAVGNLSRFGPPLYRLNIGCGADHRPGYINLDAEPLSQPDIIHNAETPWPFPDGCATEVFARHVLEHIHDIRTFMTEAYRVLRPDGVLDIHIPHHCSEFYWSDPTHVRPITRAMMDLFSRRECKAFQAKGMANTPLALYWGIDFEVTATEIALSDAWASKGLSLEEILEAAASFNNVISECRFLLRRV
jgi:SAM-dependent methyltransferase